MKFPKFVFAVVSTLPDEPPVAVDLACAALPLIVAAKELAFAGPLKPVAVAVAFAVRPSIAVVDDANASALATPLWTPDLPAVA